MKALLTALVLALVPGLAVAQALVAARYTEPTTRYDHGVLGDAVEWGALELTLADGSRRLIRLPQSRVFEDLAPRLVHGGGEMLAMVVETDLARGASLALYGPAGRVAATPFLGQRHRWLAPLGAADLDGDGHVEVAYVETPHLGKTLRVWRLADGRLTELAQFPGVTAHKIGWDHIAGGIRACGQRAEIVVASGDWADLLALRFDGTRLTATRLGRWSQAASDAALACP